MTKIADLALFNVYNNLWITLGQGVHLELQLATASTLRGSHPWSNLIWANKGSIETALRDMENNRGHGV
jgi:hypothetical protein